MYGLEWIERRKQRPSGAGNGPLPPVHPVVWKIGFTSLLTDISSEMVNSLLPVYLVLHLHLSTLQYGAIDGLYNGLAVALLSLAGGLLADRARRYKEVAIFGYGISAVCKLLLLFAGAAWGWIVAVIVSDRVGKGIRTAPRDAIISLWNSEGSLASAFALHRALDAGGALLGPVAAFVLLYAMPNRFDTVWLTSFVFALLGLVILGLFVENPPAATRASRPHFSLGGISGALAGRGFWTLAAVGGLLAALTLSDGFLYLLLQRRTSLTIGFFPLVYVVTAGWYMLLVVPLGRTADRWGRTPVFILGYVAVGLIYLLLLSTTGSGLLVSMVCLFLFGVYYAATEGVLRAMASRVIPAEFRTSGLAVLATFIGTGKLVSSLLVGWLWETRGSGAALVALGLGLICALPISLFWLKGTNHAQSA